jgi:hypothetical protein
MSVLLSLVPVLLLVAALAFGCYPGERALSRARQALRVARSAPPSAGRVATSPVLIVRGGLLVASSLAGRAPPRTAA